MRKKGFAHLAGALSSVPVCLFLSVFVSWRKLPAPLALALGLCFRSASRRPRYWACQLALALPAHA